MEEIFIKSSSVEKIKSNKWKVHMEFSNPKIKINNCFASSIDIANAQIAILKILTPIILYNFNDATFTIKTVRSSGYGFKYWVLRIFSCSLANTKYNQNNPIKPIYSLNIDEGQPVKKTPNKNLIPLELVENIANLCKIPHFAIQAEININ